MQRIDYGLPGTYGPNKLWNKHKIIVQGSNQAFLTWSFHNHSSFPKLGYKLMGFKKTFPTAIFLLTPFPADLCKEHPQGERSSPRTQCLLSRWCSATVCFLEAYHLVIEKCSSHLRFSGLLGLVQHSVPVICSMCLLTDRAAWGPGSRRVFTIHLLSTYNKHLVTSLC